MPTTKPNIVYIHAHDAGRFCQPYGYPVETPHLQQFAREGVLFRKNYCAAPTCSPGRAALLSGQYPHQIGMYGLTGEGWRFTDYDRHLTHVLKSEGYHTALAGVQHEASHADLSPLGYDELLDPDHGGEFYPDSVVHAEQFIARQAATRAAGERTPFFLSFGTDEPHRNNFARKDLGIGDESARFSKTRYYDPARLDWRYTAPLPNLPDLPEIRKDVESLAEGARIMDEYMGRVLDALRHFGLLDESIVIVTTDHGVEFPGGKKSLSELGTGVMLMMRGPGLPQGTVVEPIVSQIDVAPTLMELIGADRRPWYEGSSLLPLVRGEQESLHEYVFTEQTYHGSPEPIRAIRSERYRLVRHLKMPYPHMKHDGPSTPVMDAAGYYRHEDRPEELYDLYLDPQEAFNRVDEPGYREIRTELSTALDEHLERTDDPFRTGEIPERPGR